MQRTLACWMAVLVLAPAPARAGELEEAAGLLDRMEYKQALKLVGRALKSPDNGPEELVAGYRIQGLCLSALGKTGRALSAFRRLLAIDPTFRLSQDISPKLAAPFYQAVAMAQNQEGISLEHTRPEAPASLGGAELSIILAGDPLGMVKTVQMRFRTDLDDKERRMVARIKQPGKVVMRLPKQLQAREIRYHFVAENRHGGTLARLRRQDDPFVLAAKPPPPAPEAPPVEEPPRPVALVVPPPEPVREATVPTEPDSWKETGDGAAPWYRTWWFWTAAGVAAAMIVGGAVLAAESGVEVGPVNYGIRIE